MREKNCVLLGNCDLTGGGGGNFLYGQKRRGDLREKGMKGRKIWGILLDLKNELISAGEYNVGNEETLNRILHSFLTISFYLKINVKIIIINVNILLLNFTVNPLFFQAAAVDPMIGPFHSSIGVYFVVHLLSGPV